MFFSPLFCYSHSTPTIAHRHRDYQHSINESKRNQSLAHATAIHNVEENGRNSASCLRQVPCGARNFGQKQPKKTPNHQQMFAAKSVPSIGSRKSKTAFIHQMRRATDFPLAIGGAWDGRDVVCVQIAVSYEFVVVVVADVLCSLTCIFFARRNFRRFQCKHRCVRNVLIGSARAGEPHTLTKHVAARQNRAIC